MFMQLYHMFVVASNQTRAHLPTRCPFFEQINIIKHHHLVGMLCPKSVTWLQPSENSWESFKKKERSNFPGFRFQILSAFPQRCNRGEHMWMILHGCVTSSHTPCLTVPTRYLWSNVQGIRVFHDRFQARIDPHSFENSEAKDGDKKTHTLLGSKIQTVANSASKMDMEVLFSTVPLLWPKKTQWHSEISTRHLPTQFQSMANGLNGCVYDMRRHAHQYCLPSYAWL